jgi:nicotinamide riboside kinase
MTALYSRVYWGRVDARTAALAAAHDYALTLVTAPDTPWVPDGLMRESEEVRQRVLRDAGGGAGRTRIPFALVTGDLPRGCGRSRTSGGGARVRAYAWTPA